MHWRAQHQRAVSRIDALKIMKEGIVGALSILEKGVVSVPDGEENASWRGRRSIIQRWVRWSVNRLKKLRIHRRNQKMN